MVQVTRAGAHPSSSVCLKPSRSWAMRSGDSDARLTSSMLLAPDAASSSAHPNVYAELSKNDMVTGFGSLHCVAL